MANLKLNYREPGKWTLAQGRLTIIRWTVKPECAVTREAFWRISRVPSDYSYVPRADWTAPWAALEGWIHPLCLRPLNLKESNPLDLWEEDFHFPTNDLEIITPWVN